MPKRNDTKPWERQEGESVKAFEAFIVYLNLGEERSLRAVGQKLGKSRALIERWSSDNGWVKRVAAYDADVQRKAHAVTVEKQKKMIDRHIGIALKIQEKALKALEKMDPENLDPKLMLSMLREATKLEQDMRAAAISTSKAATVEAENLVETESEDVVIYLPENGRD